MILLAIDPGDKLSAFVLFDAIQQRPVAFGKIDNDAMLREISVQTVVDAVVIERIRGQGKRASTHEWETAEWVGRFEQHALAVGLQVVKVSRQAVKSALLKTIGGNDREVRAALIKRYGGKEAAIGTASRPGPLFGVANDVWAALAIACTHADKHLPSIPFTP